MFAAASLRDAFEALTDRFRASAEAKVRLSFASSSTLARQIAHGAPADIYVSASTAWMDYVRQRQSVPPHAVSTLASNRLVVIAPRGRGPSVFDPTSEADWRDALGDRDRLALGDPDHVPAGLYARRVLVELNVWHPLKGRLARADNVRGALALVARGEVPLGIVYATDAVLLDEVRVVGKFDVDPNHPILYPMALLAPEKPKARAFFDFARSDVGRTVLRRFGFMEPPS